MNPTLQLALTDRIERLLVRHDEIKRTIALLEQQVTELTTERDSMQTRLLAASQRLDALLVRLQDTADSANAESTALSTPTPTPTESA